MSDCTHHPAAHPDRPFWFADRLIPDDPGYSPDRPGWRAFLQDEGGAYPVEPVFGSEADCLRFIRDVALAATTICDR